MLTPEEADFVSRDPAIPGLKTVLDPLAFLEALGRVAPARDLRLARIQYVKYKPGTFCRVAYRVDVAGAPCELEARACRPEDLTSRRRKKTLEAAVPGLLGLEMKPTQYGPMLQVGLRDSGNCVCHLALPRAF